MKIILVIVCSIAALTMSACASYSPRSNLVGQSRDVLISQMGAPEREYPSKGLQKLHYPRGPAGSHTYFVYLDSNDRVIRWEQVLKEDKFDTVNPGMTKDEIIDLLGVPSVTNGLARDRGYVWHYRYETTLCQSFVLEFTKEDLVRSAGYKIRSGRTCKYVGQG